MKPAFLCPAVSIVVLTACGPRQSTVSFAQAEGGGPLELAPTLGPARSPEPELAAVGRGRLVVRVTTAEYAPGAPFRISLYRDAALRQLAAEDSTDRQGGAILGPLAPGSYQGMVRRVGFTGQRFGVRIAAGYADTLELWPGGVVRLGR